jgi:hypothetical protein
MFMDVGKGETTLRERSDVNWATTAMIRYQIPCSHPGVSHANRVACTMNGRWDVHLKIRLILNSGGIQQWNKGVE